MAPRRTVAEWVTVAKVAKSIGHVFVEGATDARVLAHLAGYPPSVDFRSADEIDCDTAATSSFCSGFRLRLYTMAMATSSAKLKNNVMCMVDSDFDNIYQTIKSPDTLLKTDYANLPALTLTEEWLRGFLMKAYGVVLDDVSWKSICDILSYAFYCRFLSCASIDPKKARMVGNYVSVDSADQLRFDSIAYTSDTFGIAKMAAKTLEKDIVILQTMPFSDVRYTCNSNDIFDLLFIYLRRLKAISGSYPRDAIKSAYLGAFDDNIPHGSSLEFIVDWVKLAR